MCTTSLSFFNTKLIDAFFIICTYFHREHWGWIFTVNGTNKLTGYKCLPSHIPFILEQQQFSFLYITPLRSSGLSFKSFHPYVSFPYPLQKSESQTFPDVFRGYRNGTLCLKWVNTNYTLSIFLQLYKTLIKAKEKQTNVISREKNCIHCFSSIFLTLTLLRAMFPFYIPKEGV